MVLAIDGTVGLERLRDEIAQASPDHARILTSVTEVSPSGASNEERPATCASLSGPAPYVELVERIRRTGKPNDPMRTALLGIVARHLVLTARTSGSGAGPVHRGLGIARCHAEPADRSGPELPLACARAAGIDTTAVHDLHDGAAADSPEPVPSAAEGPPAPTSGEPMRASVVPDRCRDGLADFARLNPSALVTDCVVVGHVAASLDREVVLLVDDLVALGPWGAVARDLATLPTCRSLVFRSRRPLQVFAASTKLHPPSYPARAARLFALRHGATHGDHLLDEIRPSELVANLTLDAYSLGVTPAPPLRGPAHLEEEPRQQEGNAQPARVVWLTGASPNWAYGINARRIAQRVEWADHDFLHGPFKEVSRSYDALVTFDVSLGSHPRSRAIRAGFRVARVGGGFPLMRLASTNVEQGNRRLRDAFVDIDAVVALSDELAEHASAFHDDVAVIPNALDLDAWSPEALRAASPTAGATNSFRVGFAAAQDTLELRIAKGYYLAEEACMLAGVELKPIGKGNGQIDNGRMLTDFYGQIDCLLHPAGYGKEGTSNVIMEALALGIPVITTRHAGFHGERLEHGRNALFAPLDPHSLAQAIRSVREDDELRRTVGDEGRRFAVEHHDLDHAARRYEAILAEGTGR